MKQWLAGTRERIERFPLSILQLAMRIGVGAVFFRSGILKINSWEFTIRLFRDEYQVPVLDPVRAAQLATIVELAVPPLLFAGLATRLATLPLLAMVTVIQVFVYPNAWSDHLLWGGVLLFLLTRGPGSISLDYWIARFLDAEPHGGSPSRQRVTKAEPGAAR